MFSRSHMLSLALKYVYNNQGCISAIGAPPTKNDNNTDHIVEPCESMRGFILTKDSISSEDVHRVFGLANIDEGVLNLIATCKSYTKFLERQSTTSFIHCEVSAFGHWYSFIGVPSSRETFDDCISNCLTEPSHNVGAPQINTVGELEKADIDKEFPKLEAAQCTGRLIPLRKHVQNLYTRT